MRGIVAVVVILSAGIASAEPPFDGLPWIWPNVITEDDPSSLRAVAYEGQDRRLFWEQWRWQSVNVHVFRARYRGDLTVEVQVGPEWRRRRGRTAQEEYWSVGGGPHGPAYDEKTERERMNTEARHIAEVIGRLPALYRRSIRVISLDAGYSHPGANRDRQTVHFYTRYNDKMNSYGSIEEIYLHEAGHLLEDEYATTACWRNAQKSDGEFISVYAASDAGSGIVDDPSGPGGEDFAETLVAYFALRWRPDRISAADRRTIQATIPARIRCMDRWGFGTERP